jgi:hypothetical protein
VKRRRAGAGAARGAAVQMRIHAACLCFLPHNSPVLYHPHTKDHDHTHKRKHQARGVNASERAKREATTNPSKRLPKCTRREYDGFRRVYYTSLFLIIRGPCQADLRLRIQPSLQCVFGIDSAPDVTAINSAIYVYPHCRIHSMHILVVIRMIKLLPLCQCAAPHLAAEESFSHHFGPSPAFCLLSLRPPKVDPTSIINPVSLSASLTKSDMETRPGTMGCSKTGYMDSYRAVRLDEQLHWKQQLQRARRPTAAIHGRQLLLRHPRVHPGCRAVGNHP